ncbi:hypothetical protein D1816_09465 [Aquimarina sp. AD10]|uniref:hypothetical protein n=1 Tax=Aquimarina sp. AD10 TaxID=1714849 RepID=UPI000E4A6F80|nr:hypothetical protein [Aquimarina sp. AD10]AXT60568.1 hypothetical protein D1816_09465 [Aquimarina sp. AD10]RKN01660.1 hypothetical protein D7033_03330 [Aquimarina sp. AD10]
MRALKINNQARKKEQDKTRENKIPLRNDLENDSDVMEVDEQSDTLSKEIFSSNKGKERGTEEGIFENRNNLENSSITNLQLNPVQLLSEMAEPRINTIGTEGSLERNRQIEIMKYLNEQVISKYFGSIPEVFRIGSLVLSPEIEKSQLRSSNMFSIPAGITNGRSFDKDLLRNNDEMKNNIRDNVLETLKRSGQLDYLNTTKLLNDKDWRIVVDIDFYYDRPKGKVVFHKDTVGRTMFVNLNFNNDIDILGPEYIVNPPIIPDHINKRRLHPTFEQNLKDVTSGLEEPTEIKVAIVKPFGIVSFVDELIHHSSPYRDHRGIPISLVPMEILLRNSEFRKMKVANDFTNLVVNALPNKTFSNNDLQQMGLEPHQIHYLFNSITNFQMRSLLHNNEEYKRLKGLVENSTADAGVRQFIGLVEDTSNISIYEKEYLKELGLFPDQINFLFPNPIPMERIRLKLNGNVEYEQMTQQAKQYEQFMSNGFLRKEQLITEKLMSEDEANALFDKYNKPDFSKAKLATVGDIALPQAGTLTRQMSNRNLLAAFKEPRIEKRQFFRTWVQAVHISELPALVADTGFSPFNVV